MVKKLKTKIQNDLKNGRNHNNNEDIFVPQEGKLDAQKFFDFVMRGVHLQIQESLLPIKRDIEDIKFLVKKLRKTQVDYELDFKSLGLTLAELGLVEVGILNSVKNFIRDKISVVLANGQIRGRVDVSRYNCFPVSENILMEIPNKESV